MGKILLLDIGNTNTHLGLATERRILKQVDIPTSNWFNGTAKNRLNSFAGRAALAGAALCSVVPRATRPARQMIRSVWGIDCLILSPKTVRGIGIKYPK